MFFVAANRDFADSKGFGEFCLLEASPQPEVLEPASEIGRGNNGVIDVAVTWKCLRGGFIEIFEDSSQNPGFRGNFVAFKPK